MYQMNKNFTKNEPKAKVFKRPVSFIFLSIDVPRLKWQNGWKRLLKISNQAFHVNNGIKTITA